MALGDTTTANLLASLQRFYSRDLLMRMIPELVYADYALKSPLPAKSGSKTMRLFRFDVPTTAGVVQIDGTTNPEGVPISKDKYRQLNLEYVDVDLSQYVQVIAISDVADVTSLFDLVGQANIQNAEDAALHCDTVTQLELVTSANAGGAVGTATGNVDYTKKNFIFAQSAFDYAQVYNGGTKTVDLVITAGDVLEAATALKVNKAPKINGGYVMAAPPQLTHDIMKGAPGDTVWVNATTYSAVQQLFNGEVGKLYGVRVVEHNNAYQSAAVAPGADPKAAYSSTGIVYSAFVFGRQAYGIPNISQLGSPYAPSVFVVSGASKSDPANQIRAMVSWKAFWAAKILQPKWIAHIYAQSTSSA